MLSVGDLHAAVLAVTHDGELAPRIRCECKGFCKRSGFDQEFEVFDPANAYVLAVVAEHSLIAQPVEDRAYNRAARSDKVGQLLLRKTQMLSEAVLAAGGESTRELVEGLCKARLGSFESKAFQPALHLALTLCEHRYISQCELRVIEQQNLKLL